MRVHRHGRLAKSFVQDHIGGLATHARQAHQIIAIIRDFRTVIIDQHLRQLDHVFGFGAIKPDGFDIIPDFVLAQRHHFFGRICDLKQVFGRLIDTDICGLGRQGHGDNQSIGIGVVQLGPRGGVELGQGRVDLGDLGPGEFWPRKLFLFRH